MPRAIDPAERVGPAETVLDALLLESRLATQDQLARLIADCARRLGASDAVAYLADLQQIQLVPLVADGLAETGDQPPPLPVEATLAGRAFQRLEVLRQAEGDHFVRVWLPLVDGSHRTGVLGVRISAAQDSDFASSGLGGLFRALAARVTDVIVAKAPYGDTFSKLRRTRSMGLAAELQWSLLPPLTFACRQMTVTAALEPAYHVGGDAFDYAVDGTTVRAAVFDAMGHGLRSSQLAAITIASYRNARRNGQSLSDTALAVHEALSETFHGEAFTTGVLAEFDTASGQLNWTNAGHPAPLLFRDGRLVKALECQRTQPLGLELPGEHVRQPITTCSERLEPDDKVLIYTDGVVEARSPDGTLFGQDRLVDLLSRNFVAELPAPETMRRIVRALREYQHVSRDDASLLLLEWRPPADE